MLRPHYSVRKIKIYIQGDRLDDKKKLLYALPLIGVGAQESDGLIGFYSSVSKDCLSLGCAPEVIRLLRVHQTSNALASCFQSEHYLHEG